MRIYPSSIPILLVNNGFILVLILHLLTAFMTWHWEAIQNKSFKISVFMHSIGLNRGVVLSGRVFRGCGHQVCGVIPCQITQWVKPYLLQICSNLVYGVIMAQHNFLSKDTNFNQFDPKVTDLWSFECQRSGAFWPKSTRKSWNLKFELVEPRLPHKPNNMSK